MFMTEGPTTVIDIDDPLGLHLDRIIADLHEIKRLVHGRSEADAGVYLTMGALANLPGVTLALLQELKKGN